MVNFALVVDVHNITTHQFQVAEVLDRNNQTQVAKIERLYRYLKQNFENQRDYSRAGDFHYGEMEMKRLQRSALQQTPYWFYRIMSGYGEMYGQALIVFFGLMFLFGAGFMFCGFTDKDITITIKRDLVL